MSIWYKNIFNFNINIQIAHWKPTHIVKYREISIALENPDIIHEVPLHGIMCGISGEGITGPIFFWNTVDSLTYVNDILTPFFKELTDRERDFAFFQQDSATESTAVDLVVACAPVMQRAQVQSPVMTSFLGEVFSGFFLICKTNVGRL